MEDHPATTPEEIQDAFKTKTYDGFRDWLRQYVPHGSPAWYYGAGLLYSRAGVTPKFRDDIMVGEPGQADSGTHVTSEMWDAFWVDGQMRLEIQRNDEVTDLTDVQVQAGAPLDEMLYCMGASIVRRLLSECGAEPGDIVERLGLRLQVTSVMKLHK